MKYSLKLAISIAAFLAVGWVAGLGAAQAQLLRVKNDYYVTELRPDKHLIGISRTNNGHTENWVNVDRRTKLGEEVRHTKRGGYRMVYLPHRDIFRFLRPGMHIRVEGGRDWNNHVVAKNIWAAVP